MADTLHVIIIVLCAVLLQVRPKAGGAHGKPWLNIDVQKTLCAKLNRALHKKEMAVTKLSKVKSQFMLQGIYYMFVGLNSIPILYHNCIIVFTLCVNASV